MTKPAIRIFWLNHAEDVPVIIQGMLDTLTAAGILYIYLLLVFGRILAAALLFLEK